MEKIKCGLCQWVKRVPIQWPVCSPLRDVVQVQFTSPGAEAKQTCALTANLFSCGCTMQEAVFRHRCSLGQIHGQAKNSSDRGRGTFILSLFNYLLFHY